MDEKAATVTQLRPVQVTESVRLDPLAIFMSLIEDMKEIETLVVIGEMPDGMVLIDGNCSASVKVFLMERAKHMLLFPEDEE